MKSYLIVILFFLAACGQNNYSLDDCESFSMKSYKGSPTHAKKLQKFCQSFDLKYTKELCASALGDLVMGAKKDYLKKKFGEKVMGCFTENDLKKFSSDYK